MHNHIRFSEAVAFAAEFHATQCRKGSSIPYVSHVIQVAGLVWEYGGTEDEVLGGLLHDAAEDCGGEATLALIREKFGPEVEDIVRQNSDSITEDKDHKAPWHERKLAYIAAIAHKSPSAILVSICDKLHNARTLVEDSRHLGPTHWNRFSVPYEDSVWYFRALVEAFEKREADDPRLKRPIENLRKIVETL